MSAEAADREAVSGSRPCTPPQASCFEFLLDPSLLEQHLRGLHPGICLVPQSHQFLEQASKPSVNEQNQVQPPADNRRNRTLKLMALKVAAHLTWDLNLLEKGLTIPVLNMLLNEFLCVSRVPPGVKHVDLDLSTLPPTTAMAVLIYNRWAIRTIVLSSFPEKQTKPGPHQLNMMSLVQQEKELTENILSVLREQATDSITVLEGALNIKKDFYIHTLRSLDLLAADPSTANGETESSTAGLRISADHLHCQVHYDLGGIYFQQGCSDPSVYEKAKEHFRKARELLTKLDSSASLCCVDEQRLAGYWSACKTLTETSDPGESQHTPYGQISCFMRNHDYGALIEAFIRDNVTLSLPHSFRHSIQLELLHKLQQGDRALEEVCHKLCVCNAVRDALEGGVLGVSFHQLLIKPSKNTISFLLEVCTRSLDKEHRSETSKRKMAIFIKTVCNRLEDVSLAFMVSSHKLFMELLQDEEKKILMEQMRKSSATVNLSAKPLPSFYDIPASASVNISQLEQQLILSLDPRHIRQILIELHGMAERPFWRVNSKWEVPVDYVNVILAIKDNLTRDLVYILMAKGLHCISIKDFAHARQLFTACLELVTEFSPKLRQVMLNELLLMEVRGHEAGAAEGNMERPPPDLVSRVRGYLEMRIHDLPLRQIVGEECVVFMLNWRENEYLTLQVPQSLVNSNPYIKLGQLIASTCKELPGPKESRRTAKELWEVVVQICSVSSQHKRSSDGRVSLLKQRESSMDIKLGKSCFCGLIPGHYSYDFFFISQDDIVNEVTAEHISIWPSSLANLQSVDVEAVVVTLKELVNYALSLNPNNQLWLCTQADIYFVTNQYSAAMHYYLQAGTVCSDYFTKPVPPDVYTDQVLKRMIKCCSLLNCHTQCTASFVMLLCSKTGELAMHAASIPALQNPISDQHESAIKAIGQTELNSSNPEEVLQLAAQKRKKKFLQALAKLYF
uniref:Integrator complex subunit 8 n=1 Tax=Cyprinus carpio TaxID=7962 RepID=A0A8C1RRM3_CYPCA